MGTNAHPEERIFWFRKKTRGSKDVCYRAARPISTNLARIAGVAAGNANVCLKHQRELDKSDERCLSVLSTTHSKKLMAILRRVYKFLDERGKDVLDYRPGSNWCNACRACYYKEHQNNKKVHFLTFIDVIDQTRGRVFPPISKHREVGWKNEAQPSFF